MYPHQQSEKYKLKPQLGDIILNQTICNKKWVTITIIVESVKDPALLTILCGTINWYKPLWEIIWDYVVSFKTNVLPDIYLYLCVPSP